MSIQLQYDAPQIYPQDNGDYFGGGIYISPGSTLNPYIAEQLGVDASDITITGASSAVGTEVLVNTAIEGRIVYNLPRNSVVDDTVTYEFSTSDGRTGTLTAEYKVLPTGTEEIQFNDKFRVIRSTAAYYGFDNYVTEADLLDTITDLNDNAEVLEVQFMSSTRFNTLTDQRRPSTEISDGVWKLDSETVGTGEVSDNGFFWARTKISDPELGVFYFDSILDLAPAPEGYVQPEPPTVVEPSSLVEAGVEGEDFIFAKYQANNENNNTAKRGFSADGDYWIKSKNGYDELIGNGQEVAFIAGGADVVRGTNGGVLSSEDVLTGLAEGSIVATKSFNSYDGIYNIANFEAGTLDDLLAAGQVNVTRIDVQTGEQIGGSFVLDTTRTYDTTGSEFTNSLSAQNGNDFGSIIAADPTLGLI